MRYVIEVYRSHEGVCGNVVCENTENSEHPESPPRPFHGWLELLSLLEPPLPEAFALGDATPDDTP
ncbi:hypothetical protein [Streptomyces sp. AN091965]|uniref:hypothetical protein n=1 Tax=Streptomyces sp. AN091965 TaxID=2927803 RepID=UPI001F619D7F|nr:hypothetical protein [Streptomyces sp. AN091965]MCI3934833.1 hypothetical protein [Streptomyces sp. AN091965]